MRSFTIKNNQLVGNRQHSPLDIASKGIELVQARTLAVPG